MRRIIAVFALFLAVGCTERAGDTAAQAADPCADMAGDGVIVSNAWVRAANEGQPTSAAYFDLCNATDGDDRLTAVQTTAAAIAELHETSRSDDGLVSMAPISDAPLPRRQTARLAPGGAHVMLMQLAGPLEPGEEVLITLEFAEAPPVTIAAEVRAMTAAHDH